MGDEDTKEEEEEEEEEVAVALEGLTDLGGDSYCVINVQRPCYIILCDKIVAWMTQAGGGRGGGGRGGGEGEGRRSRRSE